eukprot:3761569-Karenia_brevis.AAC.1
MMLALALTMVLLILMLMMMMVLMLMMTLPMVMMFMVVTNMMHEVHDDDESDHDDAAEILVDDADLPQDAQMLMM